MVTYDLPAVFDYVSKQTGQKIDYVGHSLVRYHINIICKYATQQLEQNLDPILSVIFSNWNWRFIWVIFAHLCYKPLLRERQR